MGVTCCQLNPKYLLQMSLSDDSFDMYVREKQMMLAGTAMWITQLAKNEADRKEQTKLLDHVWNCHNGDLLLQQYIDYRWTTDQHLNQARLEIAKLKLKNQELANEVERLRVIIEDNL